MAAYLIGYITVKDPSLWEQYVDGVGKSLLPFGAEIVFRGSRFRVFAGEHTHDKTVVIRFADRDTFENWYASDAYQGLISLRDIFRLL